MAGLSVRPLRLASSRFPSATHNYFICTLTRRHFLHLLHTRPSAQRVQPPCIGVRRETVPARPFTTTLATMAPTLTQMFPPKPSFTEKNLPDLGGKVYIVTGANTGVGKELSRMLYSKNARVYIMARSQAKAEEAIVDIKRAEPKSRGALAFIPLDLSDLSTIKATVDKFLAAETKLHVLFNNAGVLNTKTPKNEVVRTAQGHEQHIGVNVIGPFLLTQLLTPTLISTAKTEPSSTVRVVWVGSSASEGFAQNRVGITPEMVADLPNKSPSVRYWVSKVGNWAHGVEYARRHKADGIVSVPLNPGNLLSDLYRDSGFPLTLMFKLLMYPPINGAYTELFAGLSPEVNIETTGKWVIPFGRVSYIKEHMEFAAKTEAEGGTGGTQKFWEWTQDQVKAYL
ncbi:hypothetical protein B0I35DRAFT_424084 [Stachybotrys elegans]|uniref:Uncharacterized protein n=1 Tax=Stachybotrys elegans TaxID=80388 RepID=A0A8K0SWY5_9HYPO|nr:hypothetical protein B0I35DRAFT_424084 [Stachybotrys elegans]